MLFAIWVMAGIFNRVLDGAGPGPDRCNRGFANYLPKRADYLNENNDVRGRQRAQRRQPLASNFVCWRRHFALEFLFERAISWTVTLRIFGGKAR